MELIIRLKLREKNRMYSSQEKYSRCDAQFPGTPSPISILEARLPTLQVIYHQLHPNMVPSSRLQNRGKPVKKSRKQSQEGMVREQKTAKNHLPPNHPFWLAACLRAMMMVQVHHTEILCKRMSWMVAQTMARQLISVVNTSIWSVRCRTLLNRLSIALVV